MPNEMYDFDLNGNRKTAKIQDKNESYKTGEYNRLLSDNNYRYEYDQEGNRISKIDKDNTTTKYFWDHRNRLTKVQTPTESVEYIYDYQNRLVKRTDNQNVTTFIHNDWQIIATLDSKNNVKDRYLWGTKQDKLICNNNNWTLPDHLNTIRDIIKSDGDVATHLEYNAFGKLISETKNDTLSFAYTGKLFDQTSDLQWNINRWYDSSIGKWMNEDPIEFKGGDVNVVRYVKNTPTIFIDNDGKIPASYVFTGVRRCATWHSTLPFSITPSHYFLAVGTESFGFYQQKDYPLGPGQIIENEFSMSPENIPNSEGIYSTCSNLWIDGECYSPTSFRSNILNYKIQSIANPPYYVLGVFDCFARRETAIANALIQARARSPQTWRTFCKCTNMYLGNSDFDFIIEWH